MRYENTPVRPWKWVCPALPLSCQSFPCKWLYTPTRFKTNGESNWEMACWNLVNLDCSTHVRKQVKLINWQKRILPTVFSFLFVLVILKNKWACWRMIHLSFVDFIGKWTPFSRVRVTFSNSRALTRWIIDICQAYSEITVEVNRFTFLSIIVPESLDGECLVYTVIFASIRQGFWKVFTHGLITAAGLKRKNKNYNELNAWWWPLTGRSVNGHSEITHTVIRKWLNDFFLWVN